jgi:enoyl-CoA hydratase/carnithine racemase
MGLVTFAENEGVGVITLNSPPLNLLSGKFMLDLDAGVDAAANSSARAVIVRAEGNHFGAGADAGDMFAGVSSAQARPQIVAWVHTLRKLETLPVPVIAQVQGTCVGGGLELALYCDVIVAAASARLGHLEANLGTATLLGGAQRVAERAGPPRARMFVYTADTFDAETCERWGIVNQVVADNLLVETVDALARRLAEGPSRAHTVTKRLISAYRDRGIAAADELLLDLAPTVYDTADMRHGVDVLIEHGARKLKEKTSFVGR